MHLYAENAIEDGNCKIKRIKSIRKVFKIYPNLKL